MESTDESELFIDDRRITFRKGYLAATAAWFGSVGMGAALGYSSPTIPSLESRSSKVHFVTSDEPWLGSLMAIGALLGGLIAGTMTEKFGRKTTLILCGLPFSLGWLLMICASGGTALLFTGRILTGTCCGVISLTVPIYIAEISLPHLRGMLGSCIQLCVTLGVLFSFVVGTFVDWVWLAVMCMCFPAIMTTAMCFMPETPRWLMAHGRRNEAVVALQFLNGDYVDTEAECMAMEEVLHQHSKAGSWRDFLRPYIMKPFLLSLGLMLFQQLSGINNVIFYSSTIFKSVGSSLEPNVATIIVGAVQVLATALGSAVMDHAGRRILLLVSGAVMTLSMGTLGLFYFLSHQQGSSFMETYSWLALTSLIIYIIAFSIGYGPIPWLMMGELLPVKVRGLACGIATFFNWTLVFIVTREFHDMIEAFHEYGTYWAFGASCLVSCIFVGYFLPETKGKSLEDIESFFRSGHHEGAGLIN